MASSNALLPAICRLDECLYSFMAHLLAPTLSLAYAHALVAALQLFMVPLYESSNTYQALIHASNWVLIARAALWSKYYRSVPHEILSMSLTIVLSAKHLCLGRKHPLPHPVTIHKASGGFALNCLIYFRVREIPFLRTCFLG